MEMLHGLSLVPTLPLASLEVGQHWYWHIGNLKIHGQVITVSWFVFSVLIIAALAATRNIQKIPNGMQNFMEYVYEFVRDIARGQLGEKDYRPWLPFIGTLFLFIFVSNWSGALIPWKLIKIPEGELAAPTNDINTTVALALLTSLAYFYAGLSKKGLGYFSHYIEPIPALLPIKILEDFTKPLSLSFRLFGNIFAGETTLETMTAITGKWYTSWLPPIPFYFMELLVGLIQALVFMLLTSVFLKLLCEHHEEEGHEHH